MLIVSDGPQGRGYSNPISMTEPAIQLERLSKSYGEITAVDDLSFTIAPGTIFGFLGANGAGKTTTIRMLCGLAHPTSGKATIGGADVWRERHIVRSKFGYVAQRFSLYPDLTVEENIRFFGGACRVPRSELPARTERLLELTDLKTKRDASAGDLSGGIGSELSRKAFGDRCRAGHARARALARYAAGSWRVAPEWKPAPLRCRRGKARGGMAKGMAVPGYSLARRTLGGAGHGRCLHRLLAGLRCDVETGPIMKRGFFSAVASVAYKEFLHI